ncbi:hypothetical protein SAMN05421827_101197 [Pedobacter terrae]|uniref:Uncharacterized protein n=1 Tax=Pedobacter terrae TaxID=405671 RepID=A0A1G7N5F4_9SPHI|nr:hypothetical protein [Pedobacter terrae]SDF68560.1 hypothetical protein SAMN05421827_101197 [Pedobacter terrae]
MIAQFYAIENKFGGSSPLLKNFIRIKPTEIEHLAIFIDITVKKKFEDMPSNPNFVLWQT